MELQKWLIAGGMILLADIIWILSAYEYGTIKIYNLKEKNKYRFLGYLRIRKKKGRFVLKISRKLLEKSFTTEYKLKSVSAFHRAKRGEKIQILFENGYQTTVILREEMHVKNYIATSGQL